MNGTAFRRFLTLLIATALAAPQTARPDSTAAPAMTALVRTDRGLIQGITVGNVDQFLGIPYAAPPVGALRWVAPAAAKRWFGVRDATHLANECAQLGSDGKLAASSSEDCLYVNVYRPAGAKPWRPLPVLFYIHGGYNEIGSGNDYDPSEMAVRNGIVIVMINYRLDVFGFLALPGAHDGSLGNIGLMDQQAAMRWVRRNILAFGGDPFSVTIAGQSAGGIDVCAHLISPAASGLFTKAIMQSMYCPAATRAEAETMGAQFAATAGCADAATALECLNAKPAVDLLQAAKAQSFNARVFIDGGLVPQAPSAAFASGHWNWSPVLAGSTHDESATQLAFSLAGAKVPLPLSAQTYQQLVARVYGPYSPAVLNEYQLSSFQSPFSAFVAETTDSGPASGADGDSTGGVCAMSQLYSLFSSLTQTFRYEFDDPDTPVSISGGSLPAGVTLGAYHAGELQYLFHDKKETAAKLPDQQQLSVRMMEYWANFVKTGNPNGSGLGTWPRYEPGTHSILSLRPGGNVVIDNFEADHHCAFWAAAPPR